MMIGNLTGNEQDVCIVFDCEGKYVSVREDTDRGILYAERIHGSYLIIRPTQIAERVKQVEAFELDQHTTMFGELFAKFFPIFRGDEKE